jgi:hypothetical protein
MVVGAEKAHPAVGAAERLEIIEELLVAAANLS